MAIEQLGRGGICDICNDAYCEKLFFLWNYEYEYRMHVCESCCPKCECGSMDVEDGTDHCEQCNAVIELEEKV